MAVVMAIRYRDLGLICLLVPEAILLTYGFFGFPIWLSKAMLLSNVQTGRLLFSLGYLDVVMLIRAVAVGQSRDAAQVTRGTMIEEADEVTRGYLNSSVGVFGDAKVLRETDYANASISPRILRN